MKRILSIVSFSVLAIGGVISISSCKDKCGNTTCQNSGVCTDNKCVCPTGYTGDNCGTAVSSNIVGTYDCTRANCVPATTGGVSTWKSSITAVSGNGYQIKISNFDNGGVSVTGTVDNAGNITVTPASGTYGISATGKSVNGTITLEFTTSSAAGSAYRCQMTMVKL